MEKKPQKHGEDLSCKSVYTVLKVEVVKPVSKVKVAKCALPEVKRWEIIDESVKMVKIYEV